MDSAFIWKSQEPFFIHVFILHGTKFSAFYWLIFADSCVAEIVALPAMRLFQRLALNKNQLAKISTTVTARSMPNYLTEVNKQNMKDWDIDPIFLFINLPTSASTTAPAPAQHLTIFAYRSAQHALKLD